MAKITIKLCKGDRDPGDLVGLREAAEILGVEPPSVSRLRNTDKMPTLIADLRSGPVWLREDVEEMALNRRRAREEKQAAREAAAAAV